jgi:hypothetical protein
MASRTSPWGAELSPRNRTARKKSPADQGPVEAGSEADTGRSQADHPPVTAGHNLLPDVDGRSAWSRKKRILVASFISDLGGKSEVSTAERILADKSATLTLQLEQLEAKLAEGDHTHTTLDLYARGCGHLQRMLKAMGISRRAKNVSPGSSALLELYRLEGKLQPDEDHDE